MSDTRLVIREKEYGNVTTLNRMYMFCASIAWYSFNHMCF